MPMGPDYVKYRESLIWIWILNHVRHAPWLGTSFSGLGSGLCPGCLRSQSIDEASTLFVAPFAEPAVARRVPQLN